MQFYIVKRYFNNIPFRVLLRNEDMSSLLESCTGITRLCYTLSLHFRYYLCTYFLPELENVQDTNIMSKIKE